MQIEPSVILSGCFRTKLSGNEIRNLTAKVAKSCAKFAERSVLCVPLRTHLASFALKFSLDYITS